MNNKMCEMKSNVDLAMEYLCSIVEKMKTKRFDYSGDEDVMINLDKIESLLEDKENQDSINLKNRIKKESQYNLGLSLIIATYGFGKDLLPKNAVHTLLKNCESLDEFENNYKINETELSKLTLNTIPLIYFNRYESRYECVFDSFEGLHRSFRMVLELSKNHDPEYRLKYEDIAGMYVNKQNTNRSDVLDNMELEDDELNILFPKWNKEVFNDYHDYIEITILRCIVDKLCKEYDKNSFTLDYIWDELSDVFGYDISNPYISDEDANNLLSIYIDMMDKFVIIVLRMLIHMLTQVFNSKDGLVECIYTYLKLLKNLVRKEEMDWDN